MSGVKRFWEKITAAKTKRFFTHWRGRSDRRSATGALTRGRMPAVARRRPVSPGSLDRLAYRGHHGVDLRVGDLREARQAQHLGRCRRRARKIALDTRV